MEEQFKERRAYSINEREFGALINQVDVLKDALKLSQNNIEIVLSNRKDIEYALKDISKSLEMLVEHFKVTDDKLNELEKKINDHIVKDVGLETLISSKLGKWLLGLIAVIASGFVITAFNHFQNLIFK